jgi:DNA-binding NarL/FixJ family response regulator
MASEIRIVIADDHPIFRRGLRQTIEADAHLKVVAEADDGETAVEQIRAHMPEVAVLDIDMPAGGGFSVARTILQERLPVAVVFLTIHREREYFEEALEAGAKGYVLKDSAITDIVNSIRSAASGQHYISPDLSTYLIDRHARSASLVKEKPSLKDLTPTEQRILKMLAECKTNKEIAARLFISARTVETHRANICNKLDIHGRHELVRFAITHKSELP